MTEAVGTPLTGRKVLAMLLGFFALIVLVNGIFLYFALSSFSGLSTENAYLKGLHHNNTLAQGRAQKAAGWNVATAVPRPAPGQPVILRVQVSDREGRALDQLKLTGTFRRPTHEGDDLALDFKALGKGGYRADAPATAGQWDLQLRAKLEDRQDYRWETRLWLK